MSLASLLNQTITISTAGGRDKFGNTVNGSAVSYSARFEKKTKTIVTEQSDRTPIHGSVFVGPGTVVAKGDKVNFESQDYKVMEIAPMVDGRGNVRHTELLVQRWTMQ